MRIIPLLVVALAAIGIAGCTGRDAQPATPSDGPSSTVGSTAVETTVVTPRVTLSDVRYECGPTDATVISFTASATEPFTGTAELVVLGSPFGSLSVELGPEPTAHVMDIELSQAAYDAVHGEVRVLVSGGSTLTSQPVRLRLLEGGGCG